MLPKLLRGSPQSHILQGVHMFIIIKLSESLESFLIFFKNSRPCVVVTGQRSTPPTTVIIQYIFLLIYLLFSNASSDWYCIAFTHSIFSTKINEKRIYNTIQPFSDFICRCPELLSNLEKNFKVNNHPSDRLWGLQNFF